MKLLFLFKLVESYQVLWRKLFFVKCHVCLTKSYNVEALNCDVYFFVCLFFPLLCEA